MLALSVLLISEYKDNFLRSCLREAFVIRWIPRFDLMGLKHIEWIQMTGLILSNSSSIHIFLWLKSPPQSSRFLWCFFRKKKKEEVRWGWMMQCWAAPAPVRKKRDLTHTYVRAGGWDSSDSGEVLFLFFSIVLSPAAALFINQPFIKQKQLPALPKRCIDNLDTKTEYLPSLPSTSARHCAW